jgi:hypothetical protein
MTHDNANFTPPEEMAIRATWATGTLPDCPRCGVRMHHKQMGGGSFGLGYSRRREWLLCPQCRRSVLFDARRGTRN